MKNIREIIIELEKLEISTPINIKKDEDYFEELKKIYEKIQSIEKEYDNEFLNKECKEILKTIELYYSGNLDQAIKKINRLFSELAKSKYLCSPINCNEAFKDFRYLKMKTDEIDEKFLEKKVDFYRARIGENVNFRKENMYHIPFNDRDRVNTERFSIPGIPCLYLGKSVYTCWVELGKPSDEKFYVSRVRVNNDLKIFNLVMTIEKIKKLSESSQEDVEKYDINLENLLEEYLRAWVISIACSFVVDQKDRKFKSEYIIPQLLMLCLRKNGIDGIAYYSKKLPEFSPILNFSPIGVNVAILADDSKIVEVNGKKYSNLIKEIEVTNPVNKAEIQNILSPRKSLYGSSDNISDSGMYINKSVILGGKWIEYEHTRFADVERFLAGK